ncbi:hypothetical protein LOTGIDRAFT_168334 [Lottia gigantea]|uniref:Calponin-homology (CH) domain-containing protein n=1 Tax=Lottia gigantea TaxID=225164 RepID=V3ZQS2_LOTGI|nr:hypothetical protein LOTGIDRAFT_168334 [Lottia gigantea]ESO84845.1 hypothetical protein LOTGIDRAFT_168334 [Lottia gigantea]
MWNCLGGRKPAPLSPTEVDEMTQDKFHDMFNDKFKSKIYTDWANHYLEKSRNKKFISDLQQDISDGVLLADVIEAVTFKGNVCNLVCCKHIDTHLGTVEKFTLPANFIFIGKR